MKKTIYLLLFTLGFSIQTNSQNQSLSPQNNPANTHLLKPETSKMSWFIVRDSTKIKIGDIYTDVKKNKSRVIITTTVVMKQSPNKWVDSTIVNAKNFKPIYHSSCNQQRDMVLKFDDKITGYYLDKQTNTKTKILEYTNKPFFDSNFYPQLLRFLPLKNGYSKTISIFDYNPKSSVGVISATIKSTEKIAIKYNGKLKQVWKVETTDDISNNNALMTYYIDILTRKLIKQELDLEGRKMIMKLIEEN
ncbi:hypothetical protein [Algibacter sp. PT7-4]|uniref:DUF3108 domain-containing protein n=1 Tax=Algibacter ulvanivorans TaxID=3400999 RepID=UPI003AAA99CD